MNMAIVYESYYKIFAIEAFWGKIGQMKHLDNICMLIIHKLANHYLNDKHLNFYLGGDAIIPNLMN